MTPSEPRPHRIDRPPPTAIYTSLRMAREGDATQPFLIVEGVTDQKVLKALVSTLRQDNRPRIFPGYGKITALKVEKLCRERGGVSPVAFVVDADYDRHVGQDRQSDTIFYTDANDMECTILAIDDVLERLKDRENLVPSEALASVLQRAGFTNWLELVVDRAAQVGQYRLIDRRDKLSLSFREKGPAGSTELPWATFLEPPDFAWNDESFRCWLRQQNNDPAERAANIQKLFAAVDGGGCKSRGLEVCRGHDLLQVLCVVQNYVAAAEGWTRYAPDQLEEILRIAVDLHRLGTTRMWQLVDRFAG